MTETTAPARASRKPKAKAPETDANGNKRPAAKQFRFGYLVHDVSRIRRSVMDDVMRPYGITRAQWSMLSTLSRSGNNGMTQVDIARLLEVGKVTVGGLIDRLEASSHVERRADDVDRRAKRVYITEKGYEVIRVMIAVAAKVNKRVLRGLSPIEVETVERGLLQVKRNLKEMAKEIASESGAPAKRAAPAKEPEAEFGE